jgi:hypothetical protein
LVNAAMNSKLATLVGDINYPSEAGRYHFLDGQILVEPRHLEIWNDYPNAVFVVRTVTAFSDVQYELGGYEV